MILTQHGFCVIQSDGPLNLQLVAFGVAQGMKPALAVNIAWQACDWQATRLNFIARISESRNGKCPR